MSGKLKITIERINKNNYHEFNDMVYWRINEVERTTEEKRASKNECFEDVYKELDHQGFYVYAAKYQDKYIAWISLMYIPKIGKWHKGMIYIDELWTAPEFRRKGVAYELMKKAFELQSKTDAISVRLYTHNPVAQKLYEKCGLEVIGEAVFMEGVYNNDL
ncbi:GNAT family N-acetyltransferase [Sporosalibacterium faouarense]|uniref:GNAT family N-acetyltransferase n=1 Tax=Sporosalibacterium faouarense TaxID=516123 RepID=UPI00141C67FC|nr:GNAT family N-acetyltransferase [Sporosalibacterium faouarense]MTI49130.1 GNAT family N-acetyltransferase [Bacillota bacterium]